ncbi:ABC transporter permease [Paenibacillus campinasensis]|uniref:ABC transporter permease n=1 Tax=Paenibacillus campinasensis TaxID=66347 RepID=A0A268EQW3_9BACL|nr:ABC transporter permease [Paenibacillus campinasensis]PAD75487.1 ABC transporter permease [Paenibacillus campinasensis]
MTFRQFASSNVLRNKRTYAAYFLCSAFSVMIFFICTLFIYHPELRQQIFYPVVVQAMAGAALIMYVFSFFFVLYSVGAFMNTRKREFGILLMHGMTDRQLGNMLFLENMIIGVSAIATGIVSGIITGKLFLMAGSAFLGISPLPFRLPAGALGLTAASYAVLFIIISLCIPWLLRSKKLIDLVQSGQPLRPEPGASRGLSVLAVVLLLLGYGLAATSTASTLTYRMVPVTLITIAGTYLFYTQLGVKLVGRIARSRPFAWKQTNLISLAGLHYRLRDHAQLFSIVTVVLAISFCSVGVFVSIPVLSKQFEEDFPAAVGYMSKEGNSLDAAHLSEISQELGSRSIPFEALTLPIKYVQAQPSRADSQPGHLLTLMSYSDYKQAVLMSGQPLIDEPPAREEALVLVASQNDRTYLRGRKLTSHVLTSGLTLQETRYTKHVAVPEYLLPDLEDEHISGLVVHDEVFAELSHTLQTDLYTGFYVEDYRQTEALVPELAPGGSVRYTEGLPYALTVSGTLYSMRDSLYSILLFAALLVGTVFFIAAGSFLYFRLYANLDADQRHYATLSRLGITDSEFSRIVTGQLGLLFFVPIGLAIVHSIFAFIALQSYFYLSIAAEMGVVLVSFLMMQVVYFFFIRSQYLRKLRKSMV